MRLLAVLLVAALLAPAAMAESLELGTPVVMRAAAVSETPAGFVGSTATITITAATNGSGHVFLDTFPLTAVDMQGSARLASRVAAQVTGKTLADHDLFFVIRSGSEQIGGPSAGGDMTVGAIAALNGWKVRPDVLMTGTIEPDGSIGPVGGIPEKAAAAAEAGLTTFLFPAGEGLAKLSATGRDVNLTEYCTQQLHIACVPVDDVIQAVNIMTDHQIVVPPVTGNVTGDDYLARLVPLSAQLVDASNAIIAEADAAGLSPATCPPGFTLNLPARLACAHATLAIARGSSANGSYYTAASQSFQAAIDAHYVRDAARFQANGTNVSDLNAILDVSAAQIESARQQIVGTPIRDTGAFESVGAAQVRLVDARSRFEAARTLADNVTTASDAFNAIYESSYAAERAQTALWWLRLGEGFPKGAAIEDNGLQGLARDEMTAAREEVSYVEAVFGQANVGGTLTTARASLDLAQRAFDSGLYAAAMLDAVDASVTASALLETAGFQGSIPAEKIEAARTASARAIQQARGRGVEPFVAESQYEFGLAQKDTGEQLRYFGLARVSANLAGLPGSFGAPAAPAQTRFQGFPTAYAPPTWIAAAFAVGMALGVGLGMIALIPSKEEDEAFLREHSAPEDTAPPW